MVVFGVVMNGWEIIINGVISMAWRDEGDGVGEQGRMGNGKI